MDSDFVSDVVDNKGDDSLNKKDQEPQLNTESNTNASSDTEHAYVYTDKPIYKTTDAGEMLGMSYNMVRYWARTYKEFLPDAINVEKGTGNLLLSSRDIEVIRQINIYIQDGLSKERISTILSDKSNKILDKPPIMTNDHFMELFRTEGFQDFMKYYTANLLEQYQATQNVKIDGLIDKINHYIEISQSDTSLPPTDDHENELKEIYRQLEEKDLAIKSMEESQRQAAESIKELNAKLEEERNKSLFAKLFRKN